MNNETLQRPRTVAIPYDGSMRYMVPSARDPEEKYLVDVEAYRGNGKCVCPHFEFNIEPLISRGVTPQQAIDQMYLDTLSAKLAMKKPLRAIKLKVNRHIEDSLRCEHCLTARSQALDDILQAIREKYPERYRNEHER